MVIFTTINLDFLFEHAHIIFRKLARFYERFSKSNQWVIRARCGKLSQLYTSICKHTPKTRLYNPRIRLRKVFIEPGLRCCCCFFVLAFDNDISAIVCDFAVGV